MQIIFVPYITTSDGIEQMYLIILYTVNVDIYLCMSSLLFSSSIFKRL